MQPRQSQKWKNHLKTFLNGSLGLAVMAMFLVSALGYSNDHERKARDQRISFEGSLQGTETDVAQGSPPESIAVKATDIPGLATHLMEFSLSYTVTVNAADGSATGSGELVLAN